MLTCVTVADGLRDPKRRHLTRQVGIIRVTRRRVRTRLPKHLIVHTISPVPVLRTRTRAHIMQAQHTMERITLGNVETRASVGRRR